MEQGASGFESALFAAGFSDDFGAAGDLATPGTAIARAEYYALGDRSRVTSDTASADGLAGLQTLAQ